MPIRVASSLGRQTTNPDGTHNVYCTQCGEFIAKSMSNIITARCMMCERILSGEQIPPEAYDNYVMSKDQHSDKMGVIIRKVAELENQALDAMVMGDKKRKENTRISRFAGFMAKGLNLVKKKKKETDEDKKSSTELAREKKRKRLLEDIDLGDK